MPDFGSAVGASLTGLTVIVTVAVFDVAKASPSSPGPSVALYVNDVVPLKLSAGVNVTWLPLTALSEPAAAGGGLTML